MLNLLPALILLMLQGSYGADLSPRQLGLLASLGHGMPCQADAKDAAAIRRLLESPSAKQVLAARGSLGLWHWAVAAVLGEPTYEPPAMGCDDRALVVRIPDPPPDAIDDGYSASSRTRDGPISA